MSWTDRIRNWDPSDTSRLYSSRSIRRWRTQSVLAVPGAVFILLGMPMTPNVYWHVPVLVFCAILAIILVFHPIAGMFQSPSDEMERKMLATASVGVLPALSTAIVVVGLYSAAARFGWLPVLPIEPTLFDLSLGLFFTVLSIRSVLMSFQVEPLDDEGEPVKPLSPVSLPAILVGGALLMVSALFAATAATKGPRELAALSDVALEECGRGNVKSVSIAEEDYGFTCHTANDGAP